MKTQKEFENNRFVCFVDGGVHITDIYIRPNTKLCTLNIRGLLFISYTLTRLFKEWNDYMAIEEGALGQRRVI